MNILISGGTGLIGRNLTKALVDQGHQVYCLTRGEISQPSGGPVTLLHWNGRSGGDWQVKAADAQIIVNLAGENIGSGAWTREKKYRIQQSRLDAGFTLSQFVLSQKVPPLLFIQSSAIGYYGTSLTGQMDETSPAGKDYLAGVATAWEKSSAALDEAGIARAIIRTGVVLDTSEGALPRMALPFKLFAGGPIGLGKQWVSFIHLTDEIRAIQFIIEKRLQGVFNLTAPNPVTNAEMGRQLASTLHRPYWMPVPAVSLKLALGEMSTLVLDGQKVLPNHLLAEGFEFKYPVIKSALAAIYS
jgi:uncharacterized protein (TIGR01777 family)